MSRAVFCFVLNKKLESSHVGGSFVICESELMEAKHLIVHGLNMTSSNMVCVCVCVVSGLADTEWPGRTQTLKHGAVTYFLDGAHTMRSMQACVHWFRETAAQHERNAR